MVRRITHHVRQRVLDEIENLTIQFRVGAVHLKLDPLAQFTRQIANDARQFLPRISDRLHPRLHDAFLQFGGYVGQALQRHLEFVVLVAAADFEQLIASQHEFRHHGHQSVRAYRR